MASTSNIQRPVTKRRTTLIGDHPETCSAGTMDDSYEPGDVIGTGSFGIIRKVIRRSDGVVLARKELNYGRMDERDLKQLTEEVNILEQLGFNDNIVRYHERFVDKPNNMLYILMEYCEGGDLAGVINRCRKTGTLLSEDVVWAYLAQITLALYDCHTEVDETGRRKAVILHRDIKPENVFLDKDNNLKLGDFGLSKAMAQAAMTQTYVGTPYYMSPELINGQPYDVKSDIWALGCLIYELCAGHPPFHEARTQPELAVMIREGKIPDLPKAYTPHLGQVVKAMLKQSPKHRPTTSQIKALDNVKLQIRAIELRKATKELRLRDQQIALREMDLLTREAAVLAREKAVTVKEVRMRALSEELREAQARVAASALEDRENTNPDGDVLARVASRPSMVPRRPLEDRRGSSGNATSIPFPRIPSSSSLMSLDTPMKVIPNSNRRRLASKSMFDLSSAGGFPLSTPSRAVSGITLDAAQIQNNSLHSDSPSIRTAASTNRMGRSYNHLEMVSTPAFRPIAPTRTSTAPTPLPSAYDSPSTAPSYDNDDIPSPFLKKGDGSNRVAGSSNNSQVQKGIIGRPVIRSSRMSLGSKFLASKVSIQAMAGVDEVGRRISGARKLLN